MPYNSSKNIKNHYCHVLDGLERAQKKTFEPATAGFEPGTKSNITCSSLQRYPLHHFSTITVQYSTVYIDFLLLSHQGLDKITIEKTVEERILLLQEKKRALADAALAGNKLKNSRLGLDDLMALFRPGHDEEEEA